MNIRVKPLEHCPDLLDVHALDPRRYPFLLESSGGPAGLARHDILFAFPGQALTLTADWRLTGAAPAGAGFLQALDSAWRESRTPAAAGAMLPFRGGWFVFLAYELAREVEPGLALATEAGVPVAKAVRIPAAIVRDRQAGTAFALAEEESAELLGEMTRDAARASSRREPMPSRLVAEMPREPEPGAFIAAVEAIRRHIVAGDIYQANIGRRWEGHIAPGVAPWMLYARLRHANPAPFSGLALLDDVAILSSSPERLLRARDGVAETRPIAGTRPRHAAPEHDAPGLLDDPKERAEHVMLIDLERNDLGRICEAGSVRVSEFMAMETYAHVHHIVSTVTGRLMPGTTPGAALRAIFPGGSITGCPKVRCMQIVAAVEGGPRGVYTGSMGYLNHDGSCDFNILIRTMAACGDRLWWNAGSGIVADSVPARELEETRAKAKGMLLAVSG